MKIGIMTMHRGNSYGSNLQAFALLEHLRQTHQCETEFIDFYPQNVEQHLYGPPQGSGWKNVAKSLLQGGRLAKARLKQQLFDDFAGRHYQRGKRFKSVQEIFDNPPLYDVYITGSDQVFRANKPGDGYLVNYLGFCPPGSYKIAYAGSFGQEEIPESRVSKVKELLLSLAQVSCREKDGCELIKKLTGRDALFVLDPVHLLTAGQWSVFGKPVEGLTPGYILVYSLLRDEYMGDIVQKVKVMTGREVVVLDTSFPTKYKNCKYLYDIGPEQFLWLIEKASFVITNSFHGTCFSVIFGKDFYSYDIKAPGFITRSRNFLEAIGLGWRIIGSQGQVSEPDLSIDYPKVSEPYQAMIAKSKEYLDNAVRDYHNPHEV